MLISTELQEQLAKATGQLSPDAALPTTEEEKKEALSSKKGEEKQNAILAADPTLAAVWSVFKKIYLNLHPAQETLPEDRISDYQLHDIDRLGIVELSIRLEQKFHLPLDYKNIEKLSSLSEVSAYIDQHLGQDTA